MFAEFSTEIKLTLSQTCRASVSHVCARVRIALLRTYRHAYRGYAYRGYAYGGFCAPIMKSRQYKTKTNKIVTPTGASLHHHENHANTFCCSGDLEISPPVPRLCVQD